MRFIVAPRLLDHFGVAMYNTTTKALAELCANAYDADATEVDITYLADRVTILDNGIGMTPAEVQDNYLYLGRDRRDRGTDAPLEQRTRAGRAVIGNKGIGKLAGFGIAKIMTVRTWRDGAETTIVMDRDQLDEAKSLESLELPTEEAIVDPQQHGTEVVLQEWLEGHSQIDEGALRSYLARHLPSASDWKVSVNGTECSADDIPGKRFDFDDEIKNVGRVKGYYIVANDRRSLDAGFAVRVRDRIVQEASMFGLNQQTHGFFNLVRIIGELQPDFIDPVDGSNTDTFVINTSRSGFNPEDPKVQALEEFARHKLEEIARGLQKERSQARKQEALQRHPEFEERLKALGPELYGRLNDALEAMISKLSKNEDDETVDHIVDIVIRYYESDALRIILDSIRKSDPAEAKRLGELLARYGTAQLAGVADVLGTQMEVIELLRSRVEEGVLEAEIHSIIATNIWLLRDDLAYWADNKTFSTLLAEKLAQEFKLDASRRPDLVCYDNRPLQESKGTSPTRLVVVEFKRPGVTIGAEELVQVMRYKQIFAASLADIPAAGIQVVIIGDKFDASFDRTIFGAGSDYRILSYEELLQNAYHRYEELYGRLAAAGTGD